MLSVGERNQICLFKIEIANDTKLFLLYRNKLYPTCGKDTQELHLTRTIIIGV